MTAIAIWANHEVEENPGLWIAADSRVSATPGAQDFPNIGGDLQLGIADRFGFRPLTLCKPRVNGQPTAYLSYLGRELTPNITYVGEARVGGPAIA
jgi:hypothetical protein